MSREKKFVRQQDFMPQEVWNDVVVHIVGCGGIGSVAALSLGKVGCREFVLYDSDTVSEHNIPNQLLGSTKASIGKYKIDDLAGILLDLCDEDLVIKQEYRFVDDENPVSLDEQKKNIIIVGPDNMEARRSVWNYVKQVRSKEDPDFYILGYLDGRMAARISKLYTISPHICDEKDISFYESTIVPSGETDLTPCTDKATFQTNLFLGATITENIRRLLVNDFLSESSDEKKSIYKKIENSKIDFEIIFDLMNMNFLVRNP